MRLATTPLAFALSTALLLSACGGSEAPADAGATVAADPAASEEPARDRAEDPIAAVVAGDWRDEANRARDGFRHPAETLAFFGVGPSQDIVEISPGGGWYTELLAPLAQGKGSYVGVLNDPSTASSERAQAYYAEANQKLRDKLAARADVYGNATLVEIDPAAPVIGEPGSADVVLTFRNVHNWVMAGQEAGIFQAFFDVLRPGGVLGVVEHRAAEGKTLEESLPSGYVPQAAVVAMAEAAGFVLEESSEVNANPADTKDHPNGVWTLPPGNRHDEADAGKYAAIGESDRMTLRFVKPAAAVGDANAADDAAE